jgi:hypothetical protein
MTRRAMSLMDVLAPPGNDWLKEISRRRTNLPARACISFASATGTRTTRSPTTIAPPPRGVSPQKAAA